MRVRLWFPLLALLLAGCSGMAGQESEDGEARPCCYVEQGEYWLIYRSKAYCNFPRAIPCKEWPKGS
jgi:hypothetical protein